MDRYSSAIGARAVLKRRRVCLFAQYNSGERVPAHVLHSWRGLRDAGFTVHAALSGKSAVADSDRALLDAAGITAWPRPNRGHDFGAWAELIGRGVADGADDILLANDSVLGPFAPLAPTLERMAGFDAWGMVGSREGRPHLQSWFVLLTAEAWGRPAVRRVWTQDFAGMGKDEIVVPGELGLGAAFAAEQLDTGAVWRSEFRLRPSQVIATNPMHFRWRTLLDAGVPYLKRELIERNPARIMGVGRWRDELRAHGWSPDWLADIPDAPPRRHGLSARQAFLQWMLRDDRWRLLRGA